MHYKISYLLDSKENREITIEEARRVTRLTEIELLKQLEDLDVKKNGNQLVLPRVHPQTWTEIFLGFNADNFELDIEDRQRMIFLMMYSEEENASVFHFQDFLKVSRGTVLADIKELRAILAKEDIAIEYERSSGYSLSGNENNMVRLAKNNVSILLQAQEGKFALHSFISQTQHDLYAQVKDRIEQSMANTNYEMVLSRLDEMIYFSVFSKKLLRRAKLKPFDGFENVKELELFLHAETMLEEWLGEKIPETNVAIYTICLLSVLQGDIHEPAFDYLLQLSAEIIHLMEAYSAIQFKEFRELLFDFYHHLVPAYFRIKYAWGCLIRY